ncbi:MAG: carbon-nitrogen hydrolase family protein [Cyclobacteriaceae bacterium]|nr:carbon-nitrogen hydrolase family protein [Cyclobacteriaceae bacterium]
MKPTIIKVAIAQYAPVHFNKEATLQKLRSIIEEAASQKVQLLAVGETWLSGYPAWLDYGNNISQWDGPEMKQAFIEMFESSITVSGPEAEEVGKLAAQHNMGIVLGINEKVATGPGNGTLYNSLLIFNEHGELSVHHRKLMPTFTEKLLYGLGDGGGLEATPIHGARTGALICWEHWMPLARQAMHNSGEDIHVALWPNVHEMLQVASRHYAFEGRSFVLAVGQIMKASDVPKGIKLTADINNPDTLLLKGGSCIIGPDGKYIVEPIFGEEKLIVKELDISKVYGERMAMDTSGHYNRPDVFKFKVKKIRH